jgi:uncharacterized membrane protein YeaQ/YmgE (transglycosylase-associated protein family)
MADPGWLLLSGIVVGLLTRKIVGGKAYGTVADMLLGITGAFGSARLLEALDPGNDSDWSAHALLAIWGAALLPAVAHFLCRRFPHVNRGLASSSQAHRKP